MARLFHPEILSILDDRRLRKQLLENKMIISIKNNNKSHSTIQPWLDMEGNEFATFIESYSQLVVTELDKRNLLTDKLISIYEDISDSNDLTYDGNAGFNFFKDWYKDECLATLFLKLTSKEKLDKYSKQLLTLGKDQFNNIRDNKIMLDYVGSRSKASYYDVERFINENI